MIPFTDREIQRAWRENKQAYEVDNPTNAHRLLLFYAVECGLKAVLMRRQDKKRTDLCPDIATCSHNINGLLDFLKVGEDLKLPEQLKMHSIKDKQSNKIERPVKIGEINQMWRYGGCSESIDNTKDDTKLEKKLIAILEWIQGEL